MLQSFFSLRRFSLLLRVLLPFVFDKNDWLTENQFISILFRTCLRRHDPLQEYPFQDLSSQTLSFSGTVCAHTVTISAAILFCLRLDVGVEHQSMVRTNCACLEFIVIPTG